MSHPKDAAATGSNFLRQIIERDLAEGTYAGRHFAGTPACQNPSPPFDIGLRAKVQPRVPERPCK